MGIVFFCQSCGARFEVDPRMAGKQGHCKQCGQRMTIPRAEEIASMSGMPALAMAGAGAGAAAGGGSAGAAVGSSIASWLKAGLSNAALAPITVDRMKPARTYLPSALDDAEDSKPYVLAQPVREPRGRVTRHDNAALNLWRRQLGGIQKVFRKISQAAYLVSVPFLMILILGAVLKSRPMALLGATAVVLLNIGRLVAGVANLAVVPLRDGVNPGKIRKPAWRVAEPALTIVLVVLAFTFIPWLSRGQASSGGIAERHPLRAPGTSRRRSGRGQAASPTSSNSAQRRSRSSGNSAAQQATARPGRAAARDAPDVRPYPAGRDPDPAGRSSRIAATNPNRPERSDIAPGRRADARDRPMSMSTTEDVPPADE